MFIVDNKGSKLSLFNIMRSKIALVNATRNKIFIHTCAVVLHCYLRPIGERTKHYTLLLNEWVLSIVGVANCHTSVVSNDTSILYYVKVTLEMLCLMGDGA